LYSLRIGFLTFNPLAVFEQLRQSSRHPSTLIVSLVVCTWSFWIDLKPLPTCGFRVVR